MRKGWKKGLLCFRGFEKTNGRARIVVLDVPQNCLGTSVLVLCNLVHGGPMPVLYGPLYSVDYDVSVFKV